MTAPLQLPSNLTSNLQSVKVVDLRSQLPINPNYTWAQLAGTRSLKDLTTIVFHHDAWPKLVSARFSDLDLAKEIARDHIASKKNKPTGDAGFPYDAWIRNGTIYVANDMEPRKYGVSDNNAYTIHICLSGDYVNVDLMTDADRNAMYAAFFMYKSAMPSYKQLKGHKELSATSCPGYSMDKVRADLSSIEEQMSYNASPSAQTAILYSFVSRVADLGAKLTSPTIGAEARRKVMLLSDVPLGVTGDVTAEAIVKRVSEVWGNYNRYPEESARKLSLGANKYKELGLLA